MEARVGSQHGSEVTYLPLAPQSGSLGTPVGTLALSLLSLGTRMAIPALLLTALVLEGGVGV